MYEALYITKILQLIERKVNWGSSHLWTYEDYKKLQKLIFQTSSISLSTHTLERLYGKLKTHKNYKPQTDTKNALAIFLGYTDWDDFKSQNPLTPQEIAGAANESLLEKTLTASKPETKQLKYKPALFLGLIAVIIGSWVAIFSKEPASDAIDFKAVNPFGPSPHTVKFVYDLSHLEGDDFSILFPEYNDTVPLSKTDKASYKAYVHPGRYTINLLKGKQVIAQTAAYIQTQGWMGRYYSIYENERSKGSLPDTALMAKGRLFTPDSYLPDSIKSKPYYFMNYSIIRDFKVDGDNAAFETRFRSDAGKGNKICYDMWFKVIGTEGILKMHFLQSGCFGYIQMVFGEKSLKGNKYDLSPFSINMQNWNKARLKVSKKQVKILLNNSVIYQTSYANTIGKIVGIEITSKTSGETDYVKLFNAKEELIYEDDFGGEAN